MGNEEPAKGRNLERAVHFRRVEVDERAAGAIAGVEQHDVGVRHRLEQCGNSRRVGRVASMHAGADRYGQLVQLVGAPCRERYFMPGFGQLAREARRQPGARADDERRHAANLTTASPTMGEARHHLRAGFGVVLAGP